MKIIKNCIITIKYAIYNVDEEVLYSSEDKGVLTFRQGSGAVMRAIEEAVEGEGVGFKFKGSIQASKAFGEYKADYVIPYHMEHFSHIKDLKIGDNVKFQIEGCRSQEMKIVEIDGDSVIADANHECAGQDIILELEVIEVLAPIKELVKTGCSGCH